MNYPLINGAEPESKHATGKRNFVLKTAIYLTFVWYNAWFGIQHDRNIMYYYKMPVEIDIDDDADPARPSSPSWNSDTSMFWGLSQRIDNTEKQTRELSIQSERQIRLIQAITKSQNQHELEQREAMTSLLSRIEQNETSISGLQHATQSLCLNQRQTQQDVRALREELQALREQVKAQQQPRRATVLRSVIRVPVAQSLNLAQPSKSSEQVTTVGPIFKDVYGRSKLQTLNI